MTKISSAILHQWLNLRELAGIYNMLKYVLLVCLHFKLSENVYFWLAHRCSIGSVLKQSWSIKLSYFNSWNVYNIPQVSIQPLETLWWCFLFSNFWIFYDHFYLPNLAFSSREHVFIYRNGHIGSFCLYALGIPRDKNCDPSLLSHTTSIDNTRPPAPTLSPSCDGAIIKQTWRTGIAVHCTIKTGKVCFSISCKCLYIKKKTESHIS